VITGFVHDVGDFLEEHPGGKQFIAKMIGKDATTAFFGGVYEHSNGAHNVRSLLQSGILLSLTLPKALIHEASRYH
jgi:stearoyl-CoA desaturase (Delta-9 desaturase)